jgi:hypothetical protein
MKLFISHASEDKEAIVRPLAEALGEAGYDVWYDEFSLKVGDSLRRSIEQGLSACSYGIVVLSPNFFSKEWPQRELDALTAKEIAEREKVILPIWHEIDAAFVLKHSPLLADKVAVSTRLGLPGVVTALKEVLGSSRRDGPTGPEDFATWSTEKWIEVQQNMFQGAIPTSASWTELEDIVQILNMIGVPNINHTFVPTAGGLDILGAMASHENGCIDISLSREAVWLLKPSVLQFESFAPFYSVSYFRLETAQLQPSGIYDDYTFPSEELVELTPMEYVDRSVWDEQGYYDGGEFVSLDDNARLVKRWFEGVFIVVNKGSLINKLKGRYDAYTGQYSRMSKSELRKFVERLTKEASEIDLPRGFGPL